LTERARIDSVVSLMAKEARPAAHGRAT